uniref:AlNc14C1091G12770 protein n=1 Tax=Albugo laibachii Nc14 TaxID=890382 RepID=F0X2H9_9STRA|nr:AlNc14C1091G12770 [Albugo laibachii Nc14]|eukprot:CCA28080.1 AlNc14C1091G12770 [Albugo laibachii Nc14]
MSMVVNFNIEGSLCPTSATFTRPSPDRIFEKAASAPFRMNPTRKEFSRKVFATR